jgi:hypothetical protein
MLAVEKSKITIQQSPLVLFHHHPMPINLSVLRHVLSLAIPYIPRQVPNTIASTSTTVEGRRSLHAFSRKRLGKGSNADHLIGRLRHPPREHGSPGSSSDAERARQSEEGRRNWGERLETQSAPKRPVKPLAQWWAKDRVRPGGEVRCIRELSKARVDRTGSTLILQD